MRLDRRPVVVRDAVPGAVPVLAVPGRPCACGGCPRRSRPSPSSAARERSLSASVLNSTRRQRHAPERVPHLEELGLDVHARAPRRQGGATSSRSRRSRARAATRGIVSSPRSRRPASSRAGSRCRLPPPRAPPPTNALHSSRVPGWTTLSQRQVRVSREAGEPEAFLMLGPERLEPRGPALQSRDLPCGPSLDSTLGWCRSTSTPVWSASISLCGLVRSTDQAVTCPECGAAKVLKQLSSYAVHGSASKPVLSGPSGGGGGCCGGSCGCGH